MQGVEGENSRFEMIDITEFDIHQMIHIFYTIMY
jgi:hypothetical protein